jgi:hypothetical protein
MSVVRVLNTLHFRSFPMLSVLGWMLIERQLLYSLFVDILERGALMHERF